MTHFSIGDRVIIRYGKHQGQKANIIKRPETHVYKVKAEDGFTERVLAKIEGGAYGICESCGSPIGKNRLLAFPRATLCMTCKSKQERR
jgi:RNA polymerase-binding transcription factor DksA